MFALLACFLSARRITLRAQLLKESRRALWVIAEPPLRVSAANVLLRRPSGLVWRPLIMKIIIFHHEPKSFHQQISALRIITSMALTQAQSLIPKLCYLSGASNSDVSILNTWQRKTAIAINMFALSWPAFSLPPLLLFELSFFRKARELCESLLSHHCASAQQICFWGVHLALSNGL